MKESKFKSGRFWMALISAWVFAYIAVNQLIEGKDALLIIAMVFSYYFGKGDTTPPAPLGGAPA